ncbi:MAG TPA: hypothetical protein VI756_27990 [Blastocatellia bacterium]
MKKPGLVLKVRVLSSKARSLALIIAAAALVIGIATSPSIFKVVNALLLNPTDFSQFERPAGVSRFPSGDATQSCHSAEDDQLSPDVSQLVAQCGSVEDRANARQGQTISSASGKARCQKRSKIALASMLITVKPSSEPRGFGTSQEKINSRETVIAGCDTREALSSASAAALNRSAVTSGKPPLWIVKGLPQSLKLPVELRISAANRSSAVHCNEAK